MFKTLLSNFSVYNYSASCCLYFSSFSSKIFVFSFDVYKKCRTFLTKPLKNSKVIWIEWGFFQLWLPVWSVTEGRCLNRELGVTTLLQVAAIRNFICCWSCCRLSAPGAALSLSAKPCTYLKPTGKEAFSPAHPITPPPPLISWLIINRPIKFLNKSWR